MNREYEVIPEILYVKEYYCPRIEDLPVIRKDKKKLNFFKDDIIFQINDVCIGTNRDYDEEIISSSKIPIVYLTGVTIEGESIVVLYEKYFPYFKLSLPDDCDPYQWKNQIYLELKNRGLPVWEIQNIDIVYEEPTTGFRNGKPMIFLVFQFKSMIAHRRFLNEIQEMFPIPTQEEILNGMWEKRNETVICESTEEEIKAMNCLGLTCSGWACIRSGTYEIFDNTYFNAQHVVYTSTEIESLDNMEDLAEVFIDSFDVEAIRSIHKTDTIGMPEPENINDPCISIAHIIQSTKSGSQPLWIIFTWGEEKITITPEVVNDYKEIIGKNGTILLHVVRYKSESEMLQNWSVWWSQPLVSTDIIIGYNSYGFDQGFLAKKIMETYQMELNSEARCWGRLKFKEIFIKEHNLESKAFAYNQYTLTPSFGRVFIDLLVIFKRDFMLRLHNYKLNTVANYYLKIGKVKEVGYKEIKPYFLGSDIQRGTLMWYNFIDSFLDLELFFSRGHYPTIINSSRVNHVPLNFLYTRGQQIRVFGGFHNEAHKQKKTIWRPYYHPLLDNPFFEKTEDDESNYLNFSDNEDDNENDYIITTNKKRKRSSSMSFDHLFHEDQNIKYVYQKKSNVRNFGNTFFTEDNEEEIQKNTVEMEVIQDTNLYNCFLGFSDNNPKYLETEYKKLAPRIKYIGYLYNKSLDVYATGEKESLSISENKKSKNERKKKGFSGGLVMKPKPGIYYNIAVGDWNSLYPNLMQTFVLDSTALVIDPQYANCSGVEYLDIRINNNLVWRLARGVRTVLVQHTRNLVLSRKVCQRIMNTHYQRAKEEFSLLKSHILQFTNLTLSENEDEEKSILNKAYELICQKKSANTIQKLIQSTEINVSKWQLALRIIYNINIIYEQMGKKENVCDMKNPEEIKNKITYLQRDLPAILNNIQKYLSCIEDNNAKEAIITAMEIIEKFYQDFNDSNEKISIEEPKKLSIEFLLSCLQYKEKYESLASNLNSKQWELKIGANSTFGFVGAGGHMVMDINTRKLVRRGMYQIMPLAAMITFLGRYCTEQGKLFVEKKGYKVIYADTDSLFIDLGLPRGDKGLEMSFPIMKELMEELTKQFSGTMRMEHEKTAKVIILYKPKMYAYLHYESPSDPGKVKIKGMSITKRDFCTLVNNIGTEILEITLRTGEISKACDVVRTRLKDLIEGRVDPEKLAIYKKLSKKTYSGRVGHAELAKRIEQRAPGQGPKTGDSVKFIYVDVGDPEGKKKMDEKIEDYDYAIQNNLKIDYLWYIENQIRKTVSTILDPLLPKEKIDNLFTEVIELQKMKQEKINFNSLSKFNNMMMSEDFF